MNLDMAARRVARFDEYEVLVGQKLPNAVRLVAEGRCRLQDASLVTRRSRGEMDFDMSVRRIRRLYERQRANAMRFRHRRGLPEPCLVRDREKGRLVDDANRVPGEECVAPHGPIDSRGNL